MIIFTLKPGVLLIGVTGHLSKNNDSGVCQHGGKGQAVETMGHLDVMEQGVADGSGGPSWVVEDCGH